MPILPIDSCRYGSEKMKDIFEEEKKLEYELIFEGEVAIAQGNLNLIPNLAAKEIFKVTRSKSISLKRIKELEKISEHDTAAVVEAISEHCTSSAKPWVHYGLTSNDILDTCNSLQMRDALGVLEPKISKLCLLFLKKAKKYSNTPAVGRTHGQHASIISFGLKFAVWASELAHHLERIEEGKKRFLVCKTLGVVGTGSLMGPKAIKVQSAVAQRLGLWPIEAATQVVPRERIAEIQFIISLIGSTLDKIGTEIRNLQRTEIGEVEEPFRQGQMGSSAVPIKRNPIKSERVSSLARILRSLLSVALENIPLWHERDLTNSANERFTLPMSFILLDEMLDSMLDVFEKLKINQKRIKENLDKTAGQIYSEFLLERLIKKGVPRFSAYRDIQRLAFKATQENEHFYKAITKDSSISNALNSTELKNVFDPTNHLSASGLIIDRVSERVRKTISKKLL